MQTPVTRLLRRLIVPQILLMLTTIGAASVVVQATAETGYGGALIPLLAGVAAIACAASAFICLRFAQRQTREIAEQLRGALPSSVSDALRRDDARVLERLTSTFRDLISQSQKDQAQLLTIISGMTDALVATDHRQRILLINEAAVEMLGVAADARGRELWEALPVEAVWGIVAEVSLTGLRKTVHVHLAGNGRHLEVTACRLPLRPAGFIIMARDVTEATRYEELRQEFVANVSHELRTPLTLIGGYVETLLDGAVDDPDRARQYLATVYKHSLQFGNLIDDLLNLSRLDGAAKLRNPRSIDLRELAERVVELLSPAARKRGQTLSLEVTEAPAPWVRGDESDLERALTNLVDNAVKYTPEGGTVRVVLSRRGELAVVQVIDNGVGIAADDLPRIFERFYRVDRSRSREMGGTGLGLSIAKHAVQLHGGTIDVTSSPGRGCCFTILLPIDPASEDANEIKGEP